MPRDESPWNPVERAFVQRIYPSMRYRTAHATYYAIFSAFSERCVFLSCTIAGVVPSYGSTTPYQIHLYKRRHRGSTGQHITVDTLGRVLVGKFTFNLPAALFHVTNHENDNHLCYDLHPGHSRARIRGCSDTLQLPQSAISLRRPRFGHAGSGTGESSAPRDSGVRGGQEHTRLCSRAGSVTCLCTCTWCAHRRRWSCRRYT